MGFCFEVFSHTRRLCLLHARETVVLVLEVLQVIIFCTAISLACMFHNYWHDDNGDNEVKSGKKMSLWYFPNYLPLATEMRVISNRMEGDEQNRLWKVYTKGFKSEKNLSDALHWSNVSSNSKILVVEMEQSFNPVENNRMKFTLRKVRDSNNKRNNKHWKEMVFAFLKSAYTDTLNRFKTLRLNLKIEMKSVEVPCMSWKELLINHVVFITSGTNAVVLTWFLMKEKNQHTDEAIILLGGSQFAYILSWYLQGVLHSLFLTILYGGGSHLIMAMFSAMRDFWELIIIFFIFSNLVSATFVTVCFLLWNVKIALFLCTVYYTLVYVVILINLMVNNTWLNVSLPHVIPLCRCSRHLCDSDFTSAWDLFDCYKYQLIYYYIFVFTGCLSSFSYAILQKLVIMFACITRRKKIDEVKDKWFVSESSTLENVEHVFKISQRQKVLKRKSFIPRDYSLNIPYMKTTVLLDPTGRSMTPFLRTLMGREIFASERIFVEDKLISQMCMCPNYDFLFDNLTVKETLSIFSKFVARIGIDKPDWKTAAQDFNLTKLLGTRVKNLSQVDRKLLMMTIALLSSTKILILEEPTEQLKDESLKIVINNIRKRQRNSTIVMTCSNGEDTLRIADKVAAVFNGRLRMDGTPFTLTERLGVGTHLEIRKTKSVIAQLFLYVWLFTPKAKCLKNLNSDIDKNTTCFHFFIAKADCDKVQYIVGNLRFRIKTFGITSLRVSDLGIERILDRCKNPLVLESVLSIYNHSVPIVHMVKGKKFVHLKQWLAKKDNFVRYSRISSLPKKSREMVISRSALALDSPQPSYQSETNLLDFVKSVKQDHNPEAALDDINETDEVNSNENFNCVDAENIICPRKLPDMTLQANMSMCKGKKCEQELAYYCVNLNVNNNSLPHSSTDPPKENQLLKHHNMVLWGIQREGTNVIKASEYAAGGEALKVSSTSVDFHVQDKLGERKEEHCHIGTEAASIVTQTKAMLTMVLNQYWSSLPFFFLWYMVTLAVVNAVFYLTSNELGSVIKRMKTAKFHDMATRDFDINLIDPPSKHLEERPVMDLLYSSRLKNFSNFHSVNAIGVICKSEIVSMGATFHNGKVKDNKTQITATLDYGSGHKDAKILSLVYAMDFIIDYQITKEKKQGKYDTVINISINPMPMLMGERSKFILHEMQPLSTQVAVVIGVASCGFILALLWTSTADGVDEFQDLLVLSGMNSLLFFIIRHFVCIFIYVLFMVLTFITIILQRNNWNYHGSLFILSSFGIFISYAFAVICLTCLIKRIFGKKSMLFWWILMEGLAICSLYFGSLEWTTCHLTSMILILTALSPVCIQIYTFLYAFQLVSWKLVRSRLSHTDLNPFSTESCVKSIGESAVISCLIHIAQCFLYLMVYFILETLKRCSHRGDISNQPSQESTEETTIECIRFSEVDLTDSKPKQSKSSKINAFVMPFGCLAVLGKGEKSGNSKLIRLIMGLEPLKNGQIKFGRQTLSKLSCFSSVQHLKIGFCPRENGLDPRLTGRQILLFIAQMRNVTSDLNETVNNMLSSMLLKKIADKRISYYSSEDKRKLHIAMAMIGNPKYVILDHPTEVLDIVTKERVLNKIVSYRQSGNIVVVASDCAEEILYLGTSALVLLNGQTQMMCDAKDVMNLAVGYLAFVWQRRDPRGKCIPIVSLIREIKRRFHGGMFSVVDDVRDPYIIFSFVNIAPELDHARIYDTMEDLRDNDMIRSYLVEEATRINVLESLKYKWWPY